MTDLRKAAEMALEACEHLNRTGDTQVFDLCYADKVIPALRQALAQPTYEFECPRCGHCCQQRQWFGLTVKEARKFYEKYTNREELIYAIDKFLEEKNA